MSLASLRFSLRLLAIAFLLAGMSAQAQTTYTVTRFDDTSVATLEPGGGYGPGVSGDLRYGLFQAMATGGNYTIKFACSAPPCQISPVVPLPPIFEATSNTGATSIANFNLTIDGGTPGYIYIVSSGRDFWVDNVTVTFKNLELNGQAWGSLGGTGVAGGGGGAGFGGCLFVNKATANVYVQSVNFQSCIVKGGQGANYASNQFGSGAGGALGGGVNSFTYANAGGSASYGNSTGAGGSGLSGQGVSTTSSIIVGNGGAGGGGGGGGYSSQGTGGSGYASNTAGASGAYSGGAGGFGGGGGGGSFYTGTAHYTGGNGGFGGGGGGSIDGNAGAGGFGGGGGSTYQAPSGGYGGYGGGSATAVGGITGGTGATGGPYGGGGAAAGPAIFVAYGSVTINNSSTAINNLYNYNGTGATAGAAGGTGATAGTADSTPVFNYAGTVNGSTTVGPIANVLTPGTSPFFKTNGISPSDNFYVTMTFTTAVSAATAFTTTGLTLGSSTGDVTSGFAVGTPSACASGTAYAVGASCLVAVTTRPLTPGMRTSAVTLTTTSSTPTILATTYVTSYTNAPLVSSTPGTITTTAGGGSGSTPATSLTFTNPQAVALDGSGNLYIGDTYGGHIYEVNATTGATTLIAGGGSGGKTYTGAATGASMYPGSLAMDGAGNLYISDFQYNIVRVMNLTTGIITTVAGGGTNTGNGVAATSVSLTPYQVAVDAAGNLYFADSNTKSIREVNPATGIITTVAGGGSSAAEGVAATSASFGTPYGVALDASGNLYISDTQKNTVREVSGGIINTVAGGGSSTSSGISALTASLSSPLNLATDSAGNVYISDQNHHLVRRLNVATGLLYTVAGGGSSVSNNIAATNAYLAIPCGLALDTSGNLYIADYYLSTVRKVTATAANVTFPNTALTNTSATQSVLVNNIGNAPLTVSVPASGQNPSLSSNFTLSNSSTCPLVYSNSSAGTLAAGATCTEILAYTPTTSGSVSGLLTFTDNYLAETGSTQSVSLAGATSTALTVQVIGQVVAQGTATASMEYIVGYSATGAPTGTTAITLDGSTTNVGATTCTAKNLHNTCYVTITTSGLSVGQHTLSVTQPTDSNYSAATASSFLTIKGTGPQAIPGPVGNATPTLLPALQPNSIRSAPVAALPIVMGFDAASTATTPDATTPTPTPTDATPETPADSGKTTASYDTMKDGSTSPK